MSTLQPSSRRIRTLADEEDYVALNLPSIERRSLMESGMRSRSTRAEMMIVAVFLLGLLLVLACFFVPVLVSLIAHIPDLFTNAGH